MNVITTKIKSFFNLTFIKFVLVGILNTAFGVGVYCLCIYLGMQYTLATLTSMVLGVLWNFKTTGRLVFGNKDNSLIFRFIACYCVTYFLNIAIIWCFKQCGMDDYWAGILATPVVAISSYWLLKILVFGQKSQIFKKNGVKL